MKEPRAITELISIPQQHTKLQMNQDNPRYGADPTSKTTAQTIIITPNSRTCHPQGKSTKEAIKPKYFVTIGKTVRCPPQEPYHSKHHSKLSQAMACC